ncbi:unnamed protein product [Rhizophagus irregularis]|nr:unnamed protein product [Rhizophagus irregularis]
MACSKIFSGDLPELIHDIIKYFQNDFSTLHSCILVNRLWCRLAIPLLWENPFSIPTKNYKFIEIYLNNLNDELKTKLNEYKVIDNLLYSNTLFNYLSFIKCLNICRIVDFIDKWSGDILRTSKLENRDSESNFKKLIQTSLFKTFIENELNLHTLEIEILTDFYFISHTYLLFNLIKNIKHSLNYLSINCGCSNGSSILLQNLGQVLPSKLEYLKLHLLINASDFKVFLKNSKGTFIKELLIKDLKWKMNNDILPYIKKYIMKEKRVRYLNFRNFNKELFDLNDEVKEFRLYDIRVQKYCNNFIEDRQFMQLD